MEKSCWCQICEENFQDLIFANVTRRQWKWMKHVFVFLLAVMPVLNQSVLGGRGQLSVNLPPESRHGHELWVTTQRMRSGIQAVEMNLLLCLLDQGEKFGQPGGAWSRRGRRGGGVWVSLFRTLTPRPRPGPALNHEAPGNFWSIYS